MACLYCNYTRTQLDGVYLPGRVRVCRHPVICRLTGPLDTFNLSVRVLDPQILPFLCLSLAATRQEMATSVCFGPLAYIVPSKQRMVSVADTDRSEFRMTTCAESSMFHVPCPQMPVHSNRPELWNHRPRSPQLNHALALVLLQVNDTVA